MINVLLGLLLARNSSVIVIYTCKNECTYVKKVKGNYYCKYCHCIQVDVLITCDGERDDVGECC